MRFKKDINFLLKEFVFGGHIMSLSALVGGVIYKMTASDSIDLDILILIYLTFQPIYILDRLIGLSADKEDNLERTLHLEKNIVKYKFTLVVYLIGFLFINLYIRSMEIALVSTLYLVFGLLYTKLFKMITKFIPLFKNIYVAIFFFLTTVTVATYPKSHQEMTASILITAIIIFLISINVQIVFDLKDIKSDRKAGLKTLPVILGLKSSLIIVCLLSLVRSLFIAMCVHYDKISTTYLVLIMITLLEIVLVIQLWKKISLKPLLSFAFLYAISLILFMLASI